MVGFSFTDGDPAGSSSLGSTPSTIPQASTSQLPSSSGIAGLSHVTTSGLPPVKLEERERKTNAMQILQLLCDSTLLQPYLYELLTLR